MPNSINQHSGPTFIFFPFSPKGRIPADRNYLRLLHSSFLGSSSSPSAHFPSNVFFPCFSDALRSCSIFHQEAVKTILYLIPIWLHLFPLIRFHRSFNRRIFIIDLNRDHRRIVNQCKTCIRIHMTESFWHILFAALSSVYCTWENVWCSFPHFLGSPVHLLLQNLLQR